MPSWRDPTPGHAKREFGSELKRLRMSAGMSLTGLASAVHFTKGYLSKVENGQARVNRDLAKACDVALGANGQLYRLVFEDPDIQVLPDSSKIVDVKISSAALDGLEQVLRQYRAMTRSASPRLAVAAMHVHVAHLRRQHERGDGAAAALAVQAAEYTGWLERELGHLVTAAELTRMAADIARDGGAFDLHAYSRLRMADLAMDAGDPEAAQTEIATADAQVLASKPWLLGLIMLRRARVYALRGEAEECQDALVDAEALLEQQAPVDGFGEDSELSNAALVAVTRGWALFDLNHLRDAVGALEAALQVVPENNLRLRCKVRLRLALARAVGGEIEYACEQAEQIADEATLLESWPIMDDLRMLNQIMARWRTNSKVQWARTTLTAALAGYYFAPDDAGELLRTQS